MNLLWDALTLFGDLYALWLIFFRVPTLEARIRELEAHERVRRFWP